MIRLKNGNDKAREAGAGAKVEPDPGVRGEAEQLRGIGEMAVPDVREGRGRDEIVPGLPLR